MSLEAPTPQAPDQFPKLLELNADTERRAPFPTPLKGEIGRVQLGFLGREPKSLERCHQPVAALSIVNEQHQYGQSSSASVSISRSRSISARRSTANDRSQ